MVASDLIVKLHMSNILFNQLKMLFDDLKCYEYCIVKGEALSIQAYGSVCFRVSSDIDFLVPRKNLNYVEKLLLNNGFKSTLQSRKDKVFMLSSSHQISPYIKKMKPLKDIVIDLNFDLFWGEYSGKRIDISSFLSDVDEIEIYGCKVKTLSPLKSMVQLILHHYKDMNSIFLMATRKNIKYDMFKDVYYLLKNNIDSIMLDKLYAISSEHEIIPYVFYVLYYTGLLFKDEMLEKYITAFKTPEGEALLNCYGLNETERREWKCDFQARLENEYLYDLIKDDLTAKDIEKIEMNKKVFLSE